MVKKIFVNCILLNLWTLALSGLLAYFFFTFNKPWVYTVVGFASFFGILFIGFKAFWGDKKTPYIKYNWLLLLLGIGGSIVPMYHVVFYFDGEVVQVTDINEVSTADESVYFFQFKTRPEIDTTGQSISKQLDFEYFYKSNGSNSNNHFYYIIVPFSNQEKQVVWYAKQFDSKTRVDKKFRHYFLDEFLRELEDKWPTYEWFERDRNPSDNVLDRIKLGSEAPIILNPIESLEGSKSQAIGYVRLALIVLNALYLLFILYPLFNMFIKGNKHKSNN